MEQTKISLVGAGPGDPDLLSIKAVKALQKAKVVLYDALVNIDILEYAPTAKKIFVGKRSGQHSLKQGDINYLIVKSAKKYGHTVRLKGGDPLIFGRGHEELEYIRNFNIETEIIPGLSSATSLPLLQEVPLTRRGISESFWVLTGTTKEEKLSSDLKLAAQSTATVVVLMGVKKLPLIVNELQNNNKGSLPIMIIQNGSRDDEKIILSNVDNILQRAKEEKLSTPAIIVFGQTVGLHPDYINVKVKSLCQV